MTITTGGAGSGSDESNKDKCKECGNEFCDLGRQDCEMCNGYKCGVTDMCFSCAFQRQGFVCCECNAFYTHDCSAGTESEQAICDECLNIYCAECGDLKPGKGGNKRCIYCQPWWQKDKPATAFCKGCGSQRQDAIICRYCEERVCWQCPTLVCGECEKIICCEDCDYKAKMKFCEQRQQLLCHSCFFGESDDSW